MSKSEGKITGARLMVELLEEYGVDIVFGYPGGAILPFYDELYKSTKIKHILVRHEQGAIHMAEGYARSTGKLGVCIATSGPGATNLVTGLTDAKMDSVPVLAITGQVATNAIGTDAFQEADIFGITIPITKYNALIRSADEIARHFQEATLVALGGRPGPVLLDFPKDVQTQLTDVRKAVKLKINPRHYQKPPISGDIPAFAEALNRSKKPLLYVGGGAINANASKEILELAEKASIPVTTTLMGIGSFPGTHKLSVGMLGMHGTAYANKAVLECDYILNLGARFDDRVAKPGEFAERAVRAHIDIDSAEFNKRVPVDYLLHGDLKDTLKALIPHVKAVDRKEWVSFLDGIKKNHPLQFDETSDTIKPQSFLQKLYERSQGKCIVSTDVGQHQMWAAQYYLFDKPNRWLTSGGLGTMGYGLPAAIGAQFGNPDNTVICVSGDGSIQMNIQELATIAMYKLGVKVVVFNNNFLGMVRQWQELFYEERFSESEWNYNPDFVKLGEAYSMKAMRISSKSEIDKGIDFLLEDNKACFLEVMIPAEEKVFPMIPAGKSQKDMIEFRDMVGEQKK
ncbi:acetolactate synthase, large subunit, biosynthetic type [Leptospira perolatii]|uniref:Acetolactate synthase n=1 Tax=Leptospira perolatii TaxID=2023191 RepID=A0A2M9ZME4_9LEPT|nr:biosynthetic-type acetolactate synthase large subunit [Leptospira perolatii]PJZ70060.1 acetolactate synthase, large subunit, biosynthetic type [Leptospira perolatii]PJZ73248.1 acetolactate synthase, large subunit, biosynthetic type [Leptospira perolatii]